MASTRQIADYTPPAKRAPAPPSRPNTPPPDRIRRAQAQGRPLSAQAISRGNQQAQAQATRRSVANWQGESPPTVPSSGRLTATPEQMAAGLDPNLNYDWAALARAISAQDGSGGSMGGGFTSAGSGGGSSYSAPAASVIQAPSSVVTPPQIQAPTAVTNTAVSAPGAPTGEQFTSVGAGGTFGMFDRMRNQRSPRSGLSVTPEMLRAAAAARLGSG